MSTTLWRVIKKHHSHPNLHTATSFISWRLHESRHCQQRQYKRSSSFFGSCGSTATRRGKRFLIVSKSDVRQNVSVATATYRKLVVCGVNLSPHSCRQMFWKVSRCWRSMRKIRPSGQRDKMSWTCFRIHFLLLYILPVRCTGATFHWMSAISLLSLKVNLNFNEFFPPL